MQMFSLLVGFPILYDYIVSIRERERERERERGEGERVYALQITVVFHLELVLLGLQPFLATTI